MKILAICCLSCWLFLSTVANHNFAKTNQTLKDELRLVAANQEVRIQTDVAKARLIFLYGFDAGFTGCSNIHSGVYTNEQSSTEAFNRSIAEGLAKCEDEFGFK